MVYVNGFSLKSFKSMEGRDGICMSGTLVKDKKPLATFFNDGFGGATDFRKVDPDAFKKEAEVVQKIFKEKKFVSEKLSDVGTCMEVLVSNVVEATETIKSAKRRAKKDGFDKFHFLVYSQKCGVKKTHWIALHYYLCMGGNSKGIDKEMPSPYAGEEPLKLYCDIVLDTNARDYHVNLW